MKTLILAVCGLGILAGIFCFNRPRTTAYAPNTTVTEPSAAPTAEAAIKTEPVVAVTSTPAATVVVPTPSMPPQVPVQHVAEASSATSKSRADQALVGQALDILVSPQVAYGQK